MDKKKLCVMTVFAYTGILLTTLNLFASGTSKIKKSQRNEFFKQYIENGIEKIKPYAKMPKREETLSSENYDRVVTEFSWWLNKIMDPNYVPEESFIKENIRLLSAKNNKNREDLAFLSYAIDDENYMIVQTGGLNASMWIFLYETAGVQVTSVDETNSKVQDFLKKYIKKEIKSNIPSLVIEEKTNFYVGEVKSTGKKINRAKCVVGDKEICLSVQKISFEGTNPGKEPMADEWFSWCRNKEKRGTPGAVTTRRGRGREN